MNQVESGVGMAVLAMASVGLWTLRVALTARGRKLVGAGVAAVEAVVFALAFTSLSSNLRSPVRLIGYAAGVALGTLLGLAVNERLPTGAPEVDIVVDGHDPPLTERLRRLGWPATAFPGEGPSGPVTVICVAVDQSEVSDLTDTLIRLAPEAFWTVQDLGPVHRPGPPTRVRCSPSRIHPNPYNGEDPSTSSSRPDLTRGRSGPPGASPGPSLLPNPGR